MFHKNHGAHIKSHTGISTRLDIVMLCVLHMRVVNVRTIRSSCAQAAGEARARSDRFVCRACSVMLYLVMYHVSSAAVVVDVVCGGR